LDQGGDSNEREEKKKGRREIERYIGKKTKKRSGVGEMETRSIEEGILHRVFGSREGASQHLEAHLGNCKNKLWRGKKKSKMKFKSSVPLSGTEKSKGGKYLPSANQR